MSVEFGPALPPGFVVGKTSFHEEANDAALENVTGGMKEEPEHIKRRREELRTPITEHEYGRRKGHCSDVFPVLFLSFVSLSLSLSFVSLSLFLSFFLYVCMCVFLCLTWFHVRMDHVSIEMDEWKKGWYPCIGIYLYRVFIFKFVSACISMDRLDDVLLS